MSRPEGAVADARALHQLRLADARWRGVLATIRDAFIAIDTSGLVTVFSPAAEQVFGYGTRG